MTQYRKCVFIKDSGKPCHRKGDGNPPLCPQHEELVFQHEHQELMDSVLDSVLDHPRVANAIEGARSFLDRVAQGEFLRRPAQEPSSNGQRQQQQRQRPPPRRPPPGPDKGMEARVILGFDLKEKLTRDGIKSRQRALATALHPDKKGGSKEAMARVNAAAEYLLKQL